MQAIKNGNVILHVNAHKDASSRPFKSAKKQDVEDKFFLQSGLVVTNFIERFIGCTLQ